MPKKQTLEQKIGALINEHGLSAVESCVQIARAIIMPRKPKAAPKAKAAAADTP